jgi:D-alanyl-D-alanine carboxypeptidase/D-alanyl-D-alanine-endopeptidase (penicillin-binding protein 4)
VVISIPPALKPKTTTAPPKPILTPLQSALGRLFAKAGPQSGAEVYDLTARTTAFALRASVMRPPASVEKLYTTIALLSDFDPSTTFETKILGAGQLGPRGVWQGDLYLRGGGDPTLGDGTFNRVWNHGYGPTAVQLVAQLKARGVSRVTGMVFGDESLFDSARGGPASNYAPDVGDFGGQLSGLTYDHGSTSGPLSPPAFAVKELVLIMRAAHIPARAATTTAVTPADAQPLAAVSSPPLAILVNLMDVSSDDLFAEMLTKQLGVRFGGGAGTIAAGAKVIASVLSLYGVHPAIVDGSGLSRGDNTSPGQVVALLRVIWRTQVGNELVAALPLVGVSGTVQNIGVHTPAQGRCIAKTGTLNDVTNLAGYCTNRARHVLAFALFIDGPPNFIATKLLGKMVAAIAG